MSRRQEYFWAAVAFAGVWLGLAVIARADPELIRARSCLVMPFDETEAFQSYAQVANVSDKNLVIHWTFWSSSCDELADVTTCLTPGGSTVVDTSRVQNSVWIDGENQPRGDPVNLQLAAEARGVPPAGTIYATAYEAMPGDFLDCLSSGVLAPEAIVGRWATADTVAHVSAGGNAEGYGLSADGSHCELPDTTLDSLTVETFAPVSLTSSAVTIYVAAEGPTELSPACRRLGAFDRPCLVQGQTSYTNSDEVRTSLPDVLFGCSERIDLTEGITQAFSTGGTFTIDSPIIVPTDLQLLAVPVGGTTWLGGFSFEGVGPYGVGTAAFISEGLPGPTPIACPPERQILDANGNVIGCLPASPTPTPVPTPTPTPITCPEGTTPIISPIDGSITGCLTNPTPTPTPTATPEPTA